MAILYPRKQTVIIFVICVAIICSVIYITRGYRKANNTADHSFYTTSGTSTSSAANILGDSAVNTNWKEEFMSTTSYTSGIGSSSASSSRAATLTDRFANNFFTNYIQLKQSGLANDSGAMENSVDQLIANNIMSKKPVLYSLSNLRVTVDNSQSSIVAFNDAVISVLNSYNVSKNEMTIDEEALNSGDMTELNQIDPIIALYKSMINRLLSIPVPPSLAQDDLGLINALKTLQFSAESLRASGTDAAMGLVGTRSYLDGSEGLFNSLKAMRDDLQAKGAVLDFNSAILVVILGINQ